MSVSGIVGIQVCGSQMSRARIQRVGDRLEVGDLVCEELVSRPSTAGEPCVACLSAGEVMTRFWSFPRADEERLAQMVGHRLEADLPIAVNELLWGWRSDSKAGPSSQVSVLIQAARKNKAQQLLDELKEAGHPAAWLTTEAEALTALCRDGLNIGPVFGRGIQVLLLAGPHTWRVVLFEQGLARCIRRLSVTSLDEDLLGRECRLTIERECPLSEVETLWWCGSSSWDDVRDRLAGELGRSLMTVEADATLSHADGRALSVDELAAFGPVIGLALVGLNEGQSSICLVRPGSKDEADRSLHRLLARPGRWAALAGGLAVLAWLIYVGAMTWETRQMNDLLAGYDAKTSRMAALDPKVRGMERIKVYRMKIEPVVEELCAKVPSGIVLSSLQLSRERGLVLKGTSDKPKDVVKLAEDLRALDLFDHVRPGRTEPGRGGTFTVTADLRQVNRISVAQERGGRWR